jgi:hypothetical protein
MWTLAGVLLLGCTAWSIQRFGKRISEAWRGERSERRQD